MNREEFQELCELYALGVLDPADQEEVQDHLRTEGAAAEETLRRAMVLNALVMASAPEVSPPARLRSKVIASLTGKSKSSLWNWAWAGVAAGLLATAIYFGVQTRQNSSELAQVREQLRRQSAESQQAAQAFALLSDPRTKLAVAGQGRATYFLNPERGVALIASSLAEVAPGRTYQMWVIPKGQAPRPAGLFKPDAQGNVVHLFVNAIDIGTTAAMAVSVEPETGSPAPTTTPMLVAPVA
jgi:anti-sigma-K factor RskA